ncbi:MAG: hypothetical protein JRJ27_20090 [Deltaproteobacteria bacterium]|nr:hypothetical protein [Deltaproteobacteria bacterium]
MTYTYFLDSCLHGKYQKDFSFNSINKMREHLSFLIRNSNHLSIETVKYQGSDIEVKGYNLALKQYYGE